MAELTYNILYSVATGELLDLSSSALTAGTGEGVLATTIPDDFEPDYYQFGYTQHVFVDGDNSKGLNVYLFTNTVSSDSLVLDASSTTRAAYANNVLTIGVSGAPTLDDIAMALEGLNVAGSYPRFRASYFGVAVSVDSAETTAATRMFGGALIKRESVLVKADPIVSIVRGAYLQAYRAEVEIVRPRLISLVAHDTGLVTLMGAWLDARWQAMRNLYQAQTLHIGGTATPVTHTLRLRAAATVALGATDAYDAQTIAVHLSGSGVVAPSLSMLFIDASGAQQSFANAVSYGRLDPDWKVININELLAEEIGSVAAITDTA